MGVFSQIASFSTALFFLAVTVYLEHIDSFLIDFTAMPEGELTLFRYAFFGLFVGFMVLTVALGDEI